MEKIDILNLANVYKTIDFSDNITTKEQYLAFKDYIKKMENIDSAMHHHYIAYWLFKHRIGWNKETNTIDIKQLHAALDVKILECWKMLYHVKNYIYGGGELCMKYESIPNFRKKVIETYNKFIILIEDGINEE